MRFELEFSLSNRTMFFIEGLVRRLTRSIPPVQGELIMSALDTLIQSIHKAETVQDGAVALIQGLKAKLEELAANGASAEQLANLAAELDQKTQPLVDAVKAGTGAETETPPADGGTTTTTPPATGGDTTPPTDGGSTPATPA